MKPVNVGASAFLALAWGIVSYIMLLVEPRTGAAFTLQAPPQPGWDGTVSCAFAEIETHRKLSYTWVVGDPESEFFSTPSSRSRSCRRNRAPPVARTRRLPARPEAQLRRRTLRLAHEGRKAHRPARAYFMIDVEASMHWNRWIPQPYRWLSIVVTLTVIANFIASATGAGQPPDLVTYSPLAPLALLLFTGLYLFALPYAGKGRGPRRAEGGQ